MLYFVIISIFIKKILFITDSFKNLIYQLLETKYFLLSDKIIIKDIKKKLTNVLKKIFQLNKNRKTLHLDKLYF